MTNHFPRSIISHFSTSENPNQTLSRQGQAQEFWTCFIVFETSFNSVLREQGNYQMFFLSLSTWTWDSFPTIRGTWGVGASIWTDLLKVIGLGWVAYEILVTAQRPNASFPSLDLTFMDFRLGSWPRACQYNCQEFCQTTLYIINTNKRKGWNLREVFTVHCQGCDVMYEQCAK